MTNRLRAQLTYLIIGLVITIIIFFVLTATTAWNVYFVWLVSASITTFGMYGIDKAMAKMNTRRIPELSLHLMAFVGGFFGAFIGIPLFRHKSNFRRNPLFIPNLIISLIVHGALIYYFWLR